MKNILPQLTLSLVLHLTLGIQISQAQVNMTGGIVGRVTGEGGRIELLATPVGTHTANYVEGITTYPVVEQKGGYPLNKRHKAPERLKSGSSCIHGKRCLHFEGYATNETLPPDRLELNVARNDHPQAMGFDDWRYFRFYLRVHPDTNLRRRSIITQVWQSGSTARPDRPALGPAFAIKLRQHPDPKKLYVDFTYRNDVSAQNLAVTFHTDVILKNKWYNYHLKMLARHPGFSGGRGAILIFKDRGLCGSLPTEAAINYSAKDSSKYKFYWGYRPDPQTYLKDTFDIRVGIYRPVPNGYFAFWMDSIKLTSTVSQMCGL